MMPFDIRRLDDMPVPTIVNTITGPLDAANDIPGIMNAANDVLMTIEGDVVYVIADVSGLNLSFGDIVQGLASAFSPSSDVRKVPEYDRRVRTILIGSG